MKRLTGQRVNGIKSGYWSPAKKDELVQRLGKYEDTGMEPEELQKTREWIPVEEQLPEGTHSVLICGKEGWIEVGWHDGYRWKTGYSKADELINVIAWRYLPEPYKAN